MPNKVDAKTLTPRELGLIRQWILEGATVGMSVKSAVINWAPLPKGLNPIYSVALSPWGRLAAAGRSNQITVYDLATGEKLARLVDPALSPIQYEKKPMYPGGLEMVELDILMVSNASLIRTEHLVVLDTISLEQAISIVIHADRQMDHQLVLGPGKDQFEPMGHIQQIAGVHDGSDHLDAKRCPGRNESSVQRRCHDVQSLEGSTSMMKKR